MIIIPIQAIPNQSFDIALDGNTFDFLIKEANGAMTIGIAINGTQVIQGLRMVPYKPLLPYKYLENGNLMLMTKNYQVAAYASFGITQTLWYFSQAEVDCYRTVQQPVFNTNFQLPLRFKPTGYTVAT